MRFLHGPASVLAVVGLLLLASGCRPNPEPSGDDGLRPGSAAGFDVIVITIDTLRADRLGCYGDLDAETPRIDSLAASGVRFVQATSGTPITLPSHATIFTGLDAPSHGVRHNGTFRLGEEEITLAEVLRDAGYATAAFVGAYVLDSRYGLAQGFEHYDDDVNPRGRPAPPGQYNERPAGAVVDAAIHWIEGRPAGGDGHPYLAWLHLFDPHTPYEPPDPWATRFAGRPYDGEVAYVDSQLGRLVDYLDSSGRSDRTLILLTADHGEGLGDHGETTHADLIYDSTMRIPLVFSNPRLWERPVVVADRLAGTVDLFPTLLGLLGLPAGPASLDGLDLTRDGASEDRAIYIETLAPLLDYGWSALHGLRRLEAKLIVAPSPEFYDLRDDPGEQINRFDSAREVGALREELQRKMDDGPSDLEVLGSEQPLDDEQRRRLAALGYVGERPRAGRLGLKDPKEMLPLWDRMNMAGRLSSAGRHDEAIAEIGAVLQQDPDSGKAWHTAAQILERAGKPAEAEGALLRAVELRPRADAYVALARFALGRGDREGFERALAMAERLDPNEGGIWIGRGHDLAMQGRFQEAEAAFGRAIEVDPVGSGAYATEQIRRIRESAPNR